MEKIKTIVLFRSNLMRNRKFQKNRKKFQKIKKIPVLASFKAKIGMKRPRKKEQQLSFRFVPTRRIIENSKKIGKKF